MQAVILLLQNIPSLLLEYIFEMNALSDFNGPVHRLNYTHRLQVRNPFKPLPSGAKNSLGTVLAQEVHGYNNLITVISESLLQVQKAFKGITAMSAQLEAIAGSLSNNQVPGLWSKSAYPSLKPLAAWMKDFCARIGFLRSWIEDGVPVSFWLPGLIFPQSFVTALLQNHARKTCTAIDTLSLGFRVTNAWQPSDVEKVCGLDVFYSVLETSVDLIFVCCLYVRSPADNPQWFKCSQYADLVPYSC